MDYGVIIAIISIRMNLCNNVGEEAVDEIDKAEANEMMTQLIL